MSPNDASDGPVRFQPCEDWTSGQLRGLAGARVRLTSETRHVYTTTFHVPVRPRSKGPYALDSLSYWYLRSRSCFSVRNDSR